MVSGLFVGTDLKMTTSEKKDLLNRFLGAVMTRIEMKQNRISSMLLGKTFSISDIDYIVPESNMRFFSMRLYSTRVEQSYSLDDIRLAELEDIRTHLDLKSREIQVVEFNEITESSLASMPEWKQKFLREYFRGGQSQNSQCVHGRLDEDGTCRTCGADRRGI